MGLKLDFFGDKNESFTKRHLAVAFPLWCETTMNAQGPLTGRSQCSRSASGDEDWLRRLQTLRLIERECDWFSMAFTAEPLGRGPTSLWMGQWLLNLRYRMHEGMNEYRQIYTSINLHLACLSTDDVSKTESALNQSRLEPKEQPVSTFKLKKHFPVR